MAHHACPLLPCSQTSAAPGSQLPEQKFKYPWALYQHLFQGLWDLKEGHLWGWKQMELIKVGGENKRTLFPPGTPTEDLQ